MRINVEILVERDDSDVLAQAKLDCPAMPVPINGEAGPALKLAREAMVFALQYDRALRAGVEPPAAPAGVAAFGSRSQVSDFDSSPGPDELPTGELDNAEEPPA